MAVSAVDPLFEWAVKESIDDKGRVTVTAHQEYNVVMTVAATTPAALATDYALIAIHAEIPQPFSAHLLHAAIQLRGRDIKNKSPLQWHVTADWTSPPYQDGSGGGGGDPNPLAQPTDVEYFTVQSDEPIDTDADGLSLTTACGEPLQGVTRPVSDLGIRLTKNFTTFTSAAFDAYKDSANSTSFAGSPRGRIRFVNVSAKQHFYAGSPYFAVTVELHDRYPYQTTDEKAWYKRIRHEGFRYKVTYPLLGTRIVLAVDDNKEPVSKPVQLNANGFKLADQTQATWIERRVFRWVDLNTMGF